MHLPFSLLHLPSLVFPPFYSDGHSNPQLLRIFSSLFTSSGLITVLSITNMGKRKAKQPKPKKPSKKESKKAATKEGLSQTSVQASSSPLTENSSNHCSMPCGCPDGNASAKQVAFVVAEDRMGTSSNCNNHCS
jgi:hypothetical protein